MKDKTTKLKDLVAKEPCILLDVYAEIIIFSYSEQRGYGRKLPIKSGYCPNHCIDKLATNLLKQKIIQI